MYFELLGALLVCSHLAFSAPLAEKGQVLPIGTILTWNPIHNREIPQGWELSNGQVVQDPESPLYGQVLPPLNTEKLFLKGAIGDQVGLIQLDTLPEHGHVSKGHTHTDAGHTHKDAGHTHPLDLPKIPFPVLLYGHRYGDSDGGPRWAIQGHWPPYKSDLALSKANIQSGKAQLRQGQADVSGMASGSSGSETRPKNVKYPFIIKVKHVDQAAIVDTIVASRSQRATRNVNLVEHLNQGHFFLRGGLLSEQGQVESFALQDHSHEDEGHTHADQGHGHDDLGHMHDLDLEDDLGHKITYDVLRPGDAWGDGDGGPKFGESFDMEGKAGTGHANIQISHAEVQPSKELIGSPIGTNVGSETRPRNMKVRYLFEQIQLRPEEFPVGAILPWLSNLAPEATNLPEGWVIYEQLNREGRFLRGGSAEEVGTFEESQMEDHTHEDKGHTHIDAGHTHLDAGHIPKIYNILIPGPAYGDQDGGPAFAEEGVINIGKTLIKESKAILSRSKASLETSKANIGKVLLAKTGLEVMPRNIGVTFIVKMF